MPGPPATPVLSPQRVDQPKSGEIIHLGLAVHKVVMTIAVLPSGAPARTLVERLPNDLAKLRRGDAR